jgi:hypothetical protein
MKVTGKIAVISAALVLAGTCAFAQTTPTNETTGIFKADGDNFMSVTDWNLVKFEKNFLYVSNTNTFDVGDAFKLNKGNLYVGVNYNGSALNQLWTDTKTVATTDTADADTGTVTTKTVTTDSEDYSYVGSWNTNDCSVLLGFGKIGVKLGLLSVNADKTGAFSNTWGQNGAISNTTGGSAEGTTTTYSDNGSATTRENTEYDPNGYWKNSTWTPSIAAGTVIALKKATVKPYVSVTANLNNGGGYFKKTVTDYSADTVTYKKVTERTDDKKYISLLPQFGAQFVIPGAFEQTFEAAVTPTIYLKRNIFTGLLKRQDVYNYATNEFDNSETTTVTTTEDSTSSTEKTEKIGQSVAVSGMGILMNLNYKATKDLAENLKLGVGASVTGSYNPSKCEITNTETTTTVTTSKVDSIDSQYNYTTVETIKSPVVTDEYAQTTVYSTAMLGISYKFVPKCTFNGGFSVILPSFNYQKGTITQNTTATTTTTVTTYSDGLSKPSESSTTATATETSKVLETVGNLSCAYALGFTFDMTDALAIDCKISTSTNNWLSGMSVACTLKF